VSGERDGALGEQAAGRRGPAGARRILFHSYHFPPIGGSGAQRPLQMVRNLPALGYWPVVVTGGGATADRWAPEDETLVAQLPPGLEVHRLPVSEHPETSSRWHGRAERWLGVDSPWSRWWKAGSTKLGVAVGDDVELVYVWMQPYDSAESGVALSRALGKPWVADLGDPWALDEMMVYPSAVHRRLALRRMGRLLGSAAAIVMSTDEAARRLLHEFPTLRGRPVLAIPNGFDDRDFETAPRPRGDDAFRLVHTGYLHTELGLEHRRRLALRRALGGSVDGLDILTRSHVYLLEAVTRLLERRPDLVGALEVHLAGVLTDADREVASRCAAVRLHGYVTHAESLELIRTADLLFLPMQNLPPGVRATIVPGKTYEYLASGTPILAAVPDGDARDILAAAGNARLCRPDDVEAMADAIAAALELHRAGQAPPEPDAEVVARFDYRVLARRLAQVFDEVIASRPIAPTP
jgi:glycosyltransferase involved in cell wall biosynthesis